MKQARSKADEALKKLEAQQTAKIIFNDIIDTIPKKAEFKKKAEYTRQYRAKQKAK